MSLFLDTLDELTNDFRKEAGYTHRLSEIPENWAQELGSVLYKQLPFLNDYEVNVTLDKQDEGRGFAFGYADISNHTERPEAEHEQAGIPHIRIPLVAEERQVRPFSVFLDGERVLPMNEERIRETLFNPASFDLSTSVPRDPSLVEPLMPPQRSGIGLGGEYKMASASPEALLMQKLSSLDTKLPEASSTGSASLPYPLEKYRGTPLLKKAIEIERRQLELDKRDTSMMATVKPAIPGDAKLSKDRRKLEYERRALELELASLVADKTKTAFKHISEHQWKAVWQTDKVQKLLAKHGGNHKHPEITNTIYDTASKAYGYHPKVYPQTAEQKAQMMQKAQQKQQAAVEKQQKQMGGAAVPPGPPAKKKTASLLLAIAPTIRESDRDAFVEKVASDPTLRAGFRRSGIAQTLVEVMDTKLASANERLSSLAESIEPTVVTFQKLPGGSFMVKSANVNAFAGGAQAEGQVVPFAEVADAIGKDTADSMKPGQTVTAVSNPIELASEEAPLDAKGIDAFGEYEVQNADGKSVKGWVFPQTISWDSEMAPQSTALFVNEKAHALQSDIVGAPTKDLSKLPVEIPKGEGMFWSSDGTATSPINIQYGITDSNGVPKYFGTDSFGNEISVSVVPNIKQPHALSETAFAVPKSWNFMRLHDKMNLMSNSENIGTAKKVMAEKTSAVLFYNGSFNFSGSGCGLNKVASNLKEDLDAIGAEFMLGLLGVDGVVAKQKVAEARRVGQVKLAGLKTITSLGERYTESVKTASAFLEKLPNLKRDLIKEAAALEDQGTVDKVLALNFINPENMATFIDYLPELEEMSERMAEMTLAGYLGMKEIPLGAVERSMHNVEEVIQGLKSIQHSQE